MDVSNLRVVIMGLGRFGGAVGAARYLAKQSARVLVTDLLRADQLREPMAQLDDLPIDYRLGKHELRDFISADLIVVNPAVDRCDNRFLRAAVAAGVPLTSEIGLLIESLSNGHRTIGVTGTAGKSTVTAMIGHILSHAFGHDAVHLGGNLGGSLLDQIQKIADDHWVVLELSSFMLEGLRRAHWSPHIAVVTNLAANHLDRHQNMRAYATAKQVILAHQKQDDYAILGSSVEPALRPRAGTVRRVERPDASFRLMIPGRHNQLNAAIAVEAAVSAGVTARQAAEQLVGFVGLPHRLELVCEHRGVRYYNDSKATTPEAAVLAIGSFEHDAWPADAAADGRAVHAILGGHDKGVDLSPLGQFAGRHCAAVYTIGTTGHTIANAAQVGLAKIIRCGTLDRAVEEAARRVHEGDVVLLSPGCASWDQFENYQERGDAFTKLISRHTQRHF